MNILVYILPIHEYWENFLPAISRKVFCFAFFLPHTSGSTGDLSLKSQLTACMGVWLIISTCTFLSRRFCRSGPLRLTFNSGNKCTLHCCPQSPFPPSSREYVTVRVPLVFFFLDKTWDSPMLFWSPPPLWCHCATIVYNYWFRKHRQQLLRG